MIGNCAECGEIGVDTDFTGADGRSVCDECRDAVTYSSLEEYERANESQTWAARNGIEEA